MSEGKSELYLKDFCPFRKVVIEIDIESLMDKIAEGVSDKDAIKAFLSSDSVIDEVLGQI